ncbi:PAS domain-containing protein [Sphingopyxis sp.]|uniref:PAS domain-containing protein n=1 Tax=Sphingopyxis sp. TaxID=1908224 RepID=UPI0025CF476B|nr:PAS domain-containing protein [Sphingopyxis sp.]MBK6414194.1 type II toxin-antitoxin system Phd/YefM family antitoxin [Sphingopyxis sp.]
MATAQEPQRVSAAEFIRGFANWRLQSAREPVVVTHHGKDAHVLISLDDYRRLDGDTDDVAGTADRLQPSLAGLVESIRDGVILIDRQWRIAAANPAASDMLEKSCADLIGVPLTTAAPRIEGSFLAQHIIRLIDHRERFSGDIPDILRPRQWLRIDLVPTPIGGAIILRDVNGTMADFAASDARQALIVAVEAQGQIGRARISVREAVDTANDVLTGMLGVDAAAIRRVRFSALLAIGHRAAFAEALESLVRSGEPTRLASQIITRDGAAIDVILTIAEVRGPYASDGAVVLVTRRFA